MAANIQAYEKRINEESKFIYALDKIMPIMADYLTADYSWKKQGIPIVQERALKAPRTVLSPDVHAYYLQLDQRLSQNPNLFSPIRK